MPKKNCPHCHTSMIDSKIPQHQRCNDSCADDWNNRGIECLKGHHYHKDAEHFYRSITVEVRGVYDGGLYIQCPDCGGTWHRWASGPLRKKAKPYIHGSI